MVNPKVSVVMSVCNGERFLREAVESVLGQSYTDFEFIIINDGSTDGTASILEGFQAKDKRIKVLSQENRGLTRALNRGIEAARGKYIARMDADDISDRDRLGRQVQYMDYRPQVGVVGGAVNVIDAAGQAVGKLAFPTRDADIKAGLAVGECPLCHPAVLMRTELVRVLGGYRAVVVDAEDYDLWLRIADRHQLANLRETVLRYRRHTGQVSVRRVQHQALSNLAARMAAAARRTGRSDFLEDTQEITPALMKAFGVSEEAQEAVLARGYLSCVGSMTEAGEYAVALEKLAELPRMPFWERAEKQLVADYHLLKARIQWRQGRLGASITSALNAVLVRPIILARPLKPLIRRAGMNWRFDVSMSGLKSTLRAGCTGRGAREDR